jgi:hypothetical protein
MSSEPAEYVPIDDAFNPSIHRINHAVKARAIHPDGPVPSIPPLLTRFAAPPEDLISKVQGRIDSLIQAAEVKKGNLHCSCRYLDKKLTIRSATKGEGQVQA